MIKGKYFDIGTLISPKDKESVKMWEFFND
jgi:hypothetical protein